MKAKMSLDFRAAFAEFLSTGLFLYFGLGTAVLMGDAFMTSLVFGLAVTACIYLSQHSNAGQLNPLVTIALAVAGYVTPLQAAINCLAQLLGSVAACGLLLLSIPAHFNTDLAANAVQSGYTIGNAFAAEVVCGFALQLVVFETVLHPRNKAGKLGPLAVGFVVFVAHGVLGPLDGCSLNPARSFGPALVKAEWHDFWIFAFAPTLGGLLAVFPHVAFLYDWNTFHLRPQNNNTPAEEV